MEGQPKGPQQNISRRRREAPFNLIFTASSVSARFAAFDAANSSPHICTDAVHGFPKRGG